MVSEAAWAIGMIAVIIVCAGGPVVMYYLTSDADWVVMTIGGTAIALAWASWATLGLQISEVKELRMELRALSTTVDVMRKGADDSGPVTTNLPARDIPVHVRP